MQARFTDACEFACTLLVERMIAFILGSLRLQVKCAAASALPSHAPTAQRLRWERPARSLCPPGKASSSCTGSTGRKSRGKTFYAQVRTAEMSLISKLFQCIVANNTAIKCDTMFTCITFYIFNGNLISCKMIRIEMTCTKTVKHVGHNSAFL